MCCTFFAIQIALAEPFAPEFPPSERSIVDATSAAVDARITGGLSAIARADAVTVIPRRSSRERSRSRPRASLVRTVASGQRS